MIIVIFDLVNFDMGKEWKYITVNSAYIKLLIMTNNDLKCRFGTMSTLFM